MTFTYVLLLAGLFLFLVLAIAVSLAQLFLFQRSLRMRLSSYGVIQAQQEAAAAIAFQKLRESSINVLDQVLKKRDWHTRIDALLKRADVPLRVGEYLLICWLLFTGVAIVLYLFHMMLFLAILIAVLIAIMPYFYLKGRIQRKVNKLTDQLIDVLSLMANSMRAGSSILQSIELVTQDSSSPIKEQFEIVLAETSVGSSLEDALWHLVERVQSYDFFLVVSAIAIQRSVGGNLAEVLGNIEHTIRERIYLMRQIRVLTAGQRISAIALALMPVALFGVLLLLDRSLPLFLITDQRGQLLLCAAVLLDLTGYFVLRRLLRINV